MKGDFLLIKGHFLATYCRVVLFKSKTLFYPNSMAFLFKGEHFFIHSPPTRHSHNPYALKPVLPSQTSIRSTQLQAVENIDTAAMWQLKWDLVQILVNRVPISSPIDEPRATSLLPKSSRDCYIADASTRNLSSREFMSNSQVIYYTKHQWYMLK